MHNAAETPEKYLEIVPEERREAFSELRNTILKNLPEGFEETISNGMIGFVVPYSIYPNGYHCKPKQPLPFINIASQKNFIALYHIGLYADKHLLNWLVNEYPKHSKNKLDMGKSCIRFKKVNQIPHDLIGELIRKMSVNEWIAIYESNLKH